MPPKFPHPLTHTVSMTKTSTHHLISSTNNREIHERIHNKFKVLSTNIRSLPKNFQELALVVETYQPDIITLSEIWDPHIGVANLKGYHDLTMKTRKLDISIKSRPKKNQEKEKI